MPEPNEPKSINKDSKPESDAKRNVAFNWILAIVAISVLTLKYPAAARTTLVFLITLGVLVFVHEWGHFQFARWAGMKVNRFGIGFPPWIFTKRYKDIDYSIGALPVGGMVDIAGLGSEEEMVATAQQDEETLSNSQRASKADAPHGQKLFQDSSLGWRFLTLFAGPLMNFIFALVVFIGVYTIWGVVDKSNVSSVVNSVRYDTPADKAGIHEGDRVIGINGRKTDDPAIIAQTIRDSGQLFAQSATTQNAPAEFEARAELGEKSTITPVTLSIVRAGKNIEKELKPTWQDLDYPTMDGMASLRAPAIGVEFTESFTFKKVGVGEAVKLGTLTSVNMVVQLTKVVGRALTFRLNKAERGSIGGPVKIAQAVGKASKNGPQELLLFAGLLSVNLGLLNLLPFPALDGGRILFLGYELVFRKPLDARKESIVHMAGMVMLLAFMLFITVRDVLPWLSRSLGNMF